MISVAMTSCNGELFIKEQLDSIINQLYPVDELVIVDDASTDNTFSILQEYAQLHKKIKVYRNDENCGFIRTFHRSISICQGDYIFLCDQDDIWFENKVKEMIDIIENNDNIEVLASSFIFIDAKDETLHYPKSFFRSNNNQLAKRVKYRSTIGVQLKDIDFHNFCQGCAIVMKRSIQQEYLHMFTSQVYHDYLINLIASYRKGLFFYNVPLFRYRLHDRNAIGLNKEIPVSKKEKLDYRTGSSKKAIEVIKRLIMLYPDIQDEYTFLNKDICFLKQHIQYIEKGQIFMLILQNINPRYFKLKTIRGRFVDLIAAYKYGKG